MCIRDRHASCAVLYKEIAPGKTSAAQSQVSAGGQRFDFVQLLVRQVDVYKRQL